MRSEHKPYIPRVDHLRFVAALIVLLYHSFHHWVPLDIHPRNPLLTLIDEGHTGVGLFMVISGFIFGILTFGSDVRYGQYIRNRVLRIYPLLVFVVFLSAARPGDQAAPLTVFLNHLIPVSSFGFEGPQLVHFPQLWSIAVEFQIYLLFPFFLRFAERYGVRYLLAFIGLLLVVRLLVWASTGTVQMLAYGSVFGRLDQFLIGLMAGRLYRCRSDLLGNPAWLVLACAVELFTIWGFDRLGGFYGNGHPSKSPIWIGWPPVEALSWAFVLLAYVSCRWSLGATFDRVTAWLGSISYSIFVMHLLVFWAWQPRIGAQLVLSADPWLDALLKGSLIVLPSTIVVAAATYYLVERPFFRYQRSYLNEAPPETLKNRKN